MTIPVSVKSASFQTINARNGKEIYLQSVWVHTYSNMTDTKPYPEELKLFLNKDSSGNPMPYPVGEYKIDPSSIVVKEGRLQFNFPKLVPMNVVPKAPKG